MEESQDTVLFINDVKDLAKAIFNNEQPHLKIIRTDYFLQSFSPNSDKVLRSLSLAKTEASLLGEGDNGHSGSVSPVDYRYRLGWEYGDPFTMQLPFSCPPIVVHVRTCQMYNSFTRPSQAEIGRSLSSEPKNVRLPSSDLTHYQQLKINIMLRLQNEDAFDVILSLPAPEIFNSGVVCWFYHTAFSGNTSYIFFELSETSSIILTILLIIGWFVCYSVQVPNEQPKLLGDSNLKKPSKRKRRRKSRKRNASLDNKDKHASSENEGKHGNIRSDNEADHNLATPFKMKETHDSRNRDGRLVHQQLKMDGMLRLQNKDAFDVILSPPAPEIHNIGVVCWVYHMDFSGDNSYIFVEQSEASSIMLMIFLIIGWFVRYSIQVPHGQPKLLGDSNLKKPSKRKRRRKSRKSNASGDSEDKHASSGNEGKHGNIRIAHKANRNLAMPSKMKETRESKSSGGCVHQRLKMDNILRLQSKDSFDVILSLPIPEIHNSRIVCWVYHRAFSSNISCVFFERLGASSIILMILLITSWFVRYSIQVPNEQLKLLGDSNLRKPSRRKRRRKSRKSNASLDSEDKHVSLGNEGKHANRNLAMPSKMKETRESKNNGGLVHQQGKMDSRLSLQNEDAFDVILSLPASEIHNSGVVCWVDHTDFSGNISHIFFKRSEASSIILMIFLIIGWFVCYSVQVPNEQSKLLGDSNLKKPSKRKRRRKSKKSKASLDSKNKYAWPGNEGKHGNIRSANEANHNLATLSKMKETLESKSSGGLVHQQLKMDSISRLQKKDAFDVILSLSALEIHNSGVVCWVYHTAFSGNISCIFFERSKASSIILMILLITGWFVCYSIQVPNEQLKLLGDSNLRKPSKRKRRRKSRKSNASPDSKDMHVSLGNGGKHGNIRSNNEANCNLAMPSKMNETHESKNSGGFVHQRLKMDSRLRLQNEDAFDVILSLPASEIHNSGVVCWVDHTDFSGNISHIFFKRSEDSSIILTIFLIIGWFVCFSVQVPNEQPKLLGDSNLKKPSKRKRRRKSKKSKASLDSKDRHASPGNEGKHCDIRSANEANRNLAMLSKTNETHESKSIGGLLHQRLKMDSILRLQNEDAFDHNSVVCWVYHTAFSGNISSIFYELSEVSFIKLMVLLITGWFVRYSIQVPNEQLKLLGHSNLRKPSKRKRRRKSRKSNVSPDSKDMRVSLGNGGKHGNIRSDKETNRNLATPSKMKETHESKNSGGLVHQRLNMDSRLSLQSEDAFDVILSLPALEIHNSEVVCWVDHTDFSGNISHIFFEWSEASSIILKIFLIIGCFVCYSVQVPNEQPKLLVYSNLKKPSERKRRRKSRKSNASLESKDKHASGNQGKHGNIRRADEANHNLTTPPRMKETHESKCSGGLFHQRLKMDNILRDVVSGLVHLHQLGIIHRDLKPQNVLIAKKLRANLSDMGSSKLLLRDTSSSEYHVADRGSLVLQAPEQLFSAHRTCSVNVLGLNCFSFFSITGGRHPFGDSLKGNCNFEENTMGLCSVEFMPEAADLFACLVHPDPYLRPKALEHVYLEDEGRLGNCRSVDEADPNLKALSKRKKQGKYIKINQSLDNKDEHGSLENDDRSCDSRSYEEGDPSLKMPSKVKETPESIENNGSLNKKNEHASSEIDGKLGTNRINDEGQSKMKVPCWIKKTHEYGKRNENLEQKDELVSPENEDRLGDSRSGDEGVFNSKTLSKRKKRCESGKSNGSLDGKEHHGFSENEGRLGSSVGSDDAWMNLKEPVGGGTPGCWIGKLFVSNTEIAKGSKGTIILEGFYEGRPVAVKRLARAHQYVASQEIESLRASDRDPNIVRLYGVENDQDFVYLALECCACSLDDLIRAHSNSSEKSVFPDDPASNAIIEYKMRLDSVKGTMQDVYLWREDGHPSPLLVKLMRDVVSGLVHLHRLGIIHGDIKPQSVLITKELCAKLSDMGSSKLLLGDMSPSGYHVPDCGSLALHTPEQLCPAHQTCSVDVFGLGCILFFCVTRGRHPFEDGLKGNSNIKEYTIDLSPVEFLPEAADLFAHLLNPNPNLRPKALEVLHHPLFWNSKTRLSFLRDISDWVELKVRGTNPDLKEKLESIAQHVFDEEWKGKIDSEVIKHMRRFRAYKFKRVRDLLRIVRNMSSHAIGLPPNIQEIVGSSAEDLDNYFAKRFPRLLIETYRFVSMCCKDEERSPFLEYFSW